MVETQEATRNLLDSIRDRVAKADPGRKFEVADVTEELRTAAAIYAAVYEGTFEFMLAMRDAQHQATRRDPRNGRLSVAQAKGVLNCIRAEIARRERQQAEQTEPVTEGKIDFSRIPDGRYAVEHGAETAYYTIGTSRNGSGKRHVCILSSDERIYVGTILSNGEYRGRHENLLQEVAKNPEAAGLLFGRTIGKCCRCGRTLTDASSREAGIGPECASKGW